MWVTSTKAKSIHVLTTFNDFLYNPKLNYQKNIQNHWQVFKTNVYYDTNKAKKPNTQIIHELGRKENANDRLGKEHFRTGGQDLSL